jgi:hypothetical protein
MRRRKRSEWRRKKKTDMITVATVKQIGKQWGFQNKRSK